MLFVLAAAAVSVLIAGFATSWSFGRSPPEKLIAVVAPEKGTSPTAAAQHAKTVEAILKEKDSSAKVRKASIRDLATVAKRGGHVPYSYMIMPNLPTAKSGELAGLPFAQREGPPDQLLIIPKKPLVFWQEQGAQRLGTTPGFITVPLSVRGQRYPIMVSTTMNISEVEGMLTDRGWEVVV